MTRVLLAFIFIVFTHIAGQAQPQAYDTKVDYQKGQQSVAAIELPYSEDITETAIKNYMAGKGLRGTSFRGFTVYRDAKVDSSGTEVMKDLHFKIERKSHEKGTSVIYLLAANPNEDPASRAPGDIPQGNAKTFLNGLVPAVAATDLEAQIKGQEEVVRKAQKKKNGLSDDSTSLEKKVRNDQADLDQNKKDEVTQQQEVDKQQQTLDSMKARRKV